MLPCLLQKGFENHREKIRLLVAKHFAMALVLTILSVQGEGEARYCTCGTAGLSVILWNSFVTEQYSASECSLKEGKGAVCSFCFY